MKIAALAMMVVTGAWATGSGPLPLDRVPVCVSEGSIVGVSQAKGLAARVFLTAGVKIEWHSMSSCPKSADAIKVTFSERTNVTRIPGALAYALPYEGTHIVIFYDRVIATDPGNLRPRLVSYVMVHEITHILQRVARHSGSGIMKANWDRKDYSEMRLDNLTFTEDDVALIHLGLAARSTAPTVASALVAAK